MACSCRACDRQRLRVEGLAAGVDVQSSRIEVSFDGPEDALRKRYALVQALLQDGPGLSISTSISEPDRRALSPPAERPRHHAAALLRCLCL